MANTDAAGKAGIKWASAGSGGNKIDFSGAQFGGMLGFY